MFCFTPSHVLEKSPPGTEHTSEYTSIQVGALNQNTLILSV